MGADPKPDEERDYQGELELDQEELARRSRDTGGDAPAAASIEEREAVARDDDDELLGGGSENGATTQR